jgi:hypothetical protein
MDPTTAIVSVLTTGAGLLATGFAKKAIADAYDALKRAIIDRLGHEPPSLDKVNAAGTKATGTELADLLREHSVGDDPKVTSLAVALADAIRKLPKTALGRAGIDIQELSSRRDTIIRNVKSLDGLSIKRIKSGRDTVLDGLQSGGTEKN